MQSSNGKQEDCLRLGVRTNMDNAQERSGLKHNRNQRSLVSGIRRELKAPATARGVAAPQHAEESKAQVGFGCRVSMAGCG